MGFPTERPVMASHTRTVQSNHPEAIFVPSGLQDTDLTKLSCFMGAPAGSPITAAPASTNNAADASSTRFLPRLRNEGFPHLTLHSRTVPSPTPASSYLPSGLQDTDQTLPACYMGCPTGRPVAASHTRTVLSQLPEAIFAPSGLQVTEKTLSSCFMGAPTGRPVAASHTRTV